jgi:C4-dicarboxylate-specific signal transduction histidine kinase
MIGLKLAECSVLPKMRNQAMKSWYSAEQWMLGSLALALMAVGCIWVLLGPLPTAFAYLTATALLIASLLVSFIVTRLVWGTRRQLAAALRGRIAHEVSQPLAAVVTNAEACLRWLDRETPNLDKVRDAVKSIVNDGHRAGEVIQRVRGLVNKTATRKVALNINDVVSEVAALVQHELVSHGVALRMGLAPALPMVLADRIQMQQVILNLVINGIEAMESLTDRPRELVIRTHQDGPRQILVMVKDCGVGIAVENADRLFNPFFTTKSSGMGMGLSICRSIIDSHGGRLSVSDNIGPGATFQFTLPLPDEDNPS